MLLFPDINWLFFFTLSLSFFYFFPSLFFIPFTVRSLFKLMVFYGVQLSGFRFITIVKRIYCLLFEMRLFHEIRKCKTAHIHTHTAQFSQTQANHNNSWFLHFFTSRLKMAKVISRGCTKAYDIRLYSIVLYATLVTFDRRKMRRKSTEKKKRDPGQNFYKCAFQEHYSLALFFLNTYKTPKKEEKWKKCEESSFSNKMFVIFFFHRIHKEMSLHGIRHKMHLLSVRNVNTFIICMIHTHKISFVSFTIHFVW